jgi:hypothetical protein
MKMSERSESIEVMKKSLIYRLKALNKLNYQYNNANNYLKERELSFKRLNPKEKVKKIEYNLEKDFVYLGQECKSYKFSA